MRLPWALSVAALTPLFLGCTTASPPPGSSAEESPPVVQRLESMLEADPRDGAVIYILARFHADTDPVTSLDLLGRLVESGWDYALDDADFESLAERPDYRLIAETLAARQPVVGHSETAFELDVENVYSEGMTWDDEREHFLLGSADQRKVLAVDRAGKVIGRLPLGDDRLLAPLGMEIDRQRDLLWVASAAAPFMADYDSALDGHSTLTAIDLSDGSITASFEIGSNEEPSLLNDLTVLRDGRVAITDSQRGVVWLASSDGHDLESLTAPDQIWAPNGIAPTPDGKSLIVASFPGLVRVDLETGSVSEIETSPAVRLNGIDGLEHDGPTLIGIQNLVGRVRIWQLAFDQGSSGLSATIVESGDETLENPTTGAIVDDHFYYMSNPGEGKGRIRMMRLPLHSTER